MPFPRVFSIYIAETHADFVGLSPWGLPPHEEISIHQATKTPFHYMSYWRESVCVMLVFGRWVSLFCAIATCPLTLIATMFYLHKRNPPSVNIVFLWFPSATSLIKCLSRCQIHLSFFLMYSVQVIDCVLFKVASVTWHNHQSLSALFKSSLDHFSFSFYFSMSKYARRVLVLRCITKKKTKPNCSVLRNALQKSSFIFLVYWRRLHLRKSQP